MVNAGRKKKVRYIQKMPTVAVFSPRGRPGRPNEIELKIDQYEALKLADFQGYDQLEGAQMMGISRSCFGRLLRGGRKIVVDALVNGKIIRIRIGDVQVGVRRKDLPGKGANVSVSKQEEIVRNNILDYSEG